MPGDLLHRFLVTRTFLLKPKSPALQIIENLLIIAWAKKEIYYKDAAVMHKTQRQDVREREGAAPRVDAPSLRPDDLCAGLALSGSPSCTLPSSHPALCSWGGGLHDAVTWFSCPLRSGWIQPVGSLGRRLEMKTARLGISHPSVDWKGSPWLITSLKGHLLLE